MQVQQKHMHHMEKQPAEQQVGAGEQFATNCRVNKNPSKAGWEYLSNGRKVSIVTVGGFNKKFTMVAPTVQKREMTMLIDVAFRENRR